MVALARKVRSVSVMACLMDARESIDALSPMRRAMRPWGARVEEHAVSQDFVWDCQWLANSACGREIDCCFDPISSL